MPSSSDPKLVPAFTKGQVNRAGLLLLDLRERVRQHGEQQALRGLDERQLDEAWEAFDLVAQPAR